MTLSNSTASSPQMSGPLQKWTNYTTGYKPRFFTLSNAILSYYRSSTDFPHACRGSISLKVARIVYDYRADPYKFQVVGKGSVKYVLRAGSETDAKKWVVALTEAKQWLQEKDKSSESLHDGASGHRDGASSAVSATDRAPSESGAGSERALSASAESPTVRATMVGTSNLLPQALFAGANSIKIDTGLAAATQKPTIHPSPSRMLTAESSLFEPNLDGNNPNKVPVQNRDFDRDADDDEDDEFIADEDDDAASYGTTGRRRHDNEHAPRDEADDGLHDALELSFGLHEKLVLGILQQSARGDELETAVRESLRTVREVFSERLRAQQRKLARWRRRFEIAEAERSVWEDQLRALALEHQEFEKRAITEIKKSRMDLAELARGGGEDPNAHSDGEDATAHDDDNDQEFFDAEEMDESYRSTGVLVATEQKKTEQADTHAAQRPSPVIGSAPKQNFSLESDFVGYPDTFRTGLPRDPDAAMPSISLWSVLKNNIGRDLTKIALPVFFNEPMSMLQRLSEDMEYSELLDVANAQATPAEQMVHVLAFAMSNYSSTIGRAGKPFNPLLGETYEFVSREKGFRYIAEQVSHHPVCFFLDF